MAKTTRHYYIFGPFQLDPAERLLLRDGRPLAITPKAFRTLLVLVQNRGRLITKEELIQEIWPNTFTEENNLARNISRIRKTLGEDSSSPKYIETVSKFGYRFTDEVQELFEQQLGPADSLAGTCHLLAVVFLHLNTPASAWSQSLRERTVAVAAECKYTARTMAQQYGSLHQESSAADQFFLFDDAGAAVQFALEVLAMGQRRVQADPPGSQVSIRVASHFGECVRSKADATWMGRAVELAAAIAKIAEPDAVCVTEQVLDLVDSSQYRFTESGIRGFGEDGVRHRFLYRIEAFDRAAFQAKPLEQLTASDWFLRAAALAGTDKENSAEEAECYRQALRLNPEYSQAHNNLGILLKHRGDLLAAAEHYREALRLAPDYPEAHYNYAILLESQGRTAGAATHYRRALRLDADYIDAHQRYANLMAMHGNLEQARSHCEQTLRLRPGSATIHNNYAILLEDLGEFEEAQKHYRQALQLRPDYPEAHYNYAILLERQSDEAGAEVHYRMALQSRSLYPEAHNNLAILLQARGELKDAEQHYREALRLRPDDPETHFNYGLLLRAKGDLKQAEVQFEVAYDLAPEKAEFRSVVEMPD